ncbi:MAG: aspartyl-tRNA(Asn)/glutamyl-tRNA(Gln) amidotransferase subunit A [Candidatus Argoarchaeum ethanivorans]|uniref:Glutamyl-tRNA(Gln) amidotransferase subunit A n=1 Tax=Candidatus Argoarchaeum ethanivorans TaxID=2608793 RepID=A0A8B3S0M8_9EURY|nr:MAG: aspartyl-tRNA(Asn)/glutamyl-tRNA(Gln) amidotransferase subunit A [Candidatus Argoarchaeum ethanivorans]
MITWQSVLETKRFIETDGAAEAVHRCFERIKQNDFNSFITLNIEDALSMAERASGGRLCGVPIAIKDNISTRGIQTTCASKILTGYIPPYNATVIERLKREGAVIIGKTNMDEFAMGTSTETSYYGAVENPWDAGCVPGGSSGGSATALAGGEVPLALGSDTGGSVRCPASFCGVVGLKPTYGAVSRYGLISYANSLEQIGPMATTVADTALLFNIVAGYDQRDSTSVNKQFDTTEPLDMKGMKIGVPEEYFGEGMSSVVEKAVWNAVHSFEDLGVEYKEVSMPHTKYSLAAYYIIAMSEASSNLARFDGLRYGYHAEEGDCHTSFSKTRAEGFGDEVKRRILLGSYALSAGYHDKYYLKSLKVRTLVKKDFEAAFKTYDMLLAPTMPYPAFKLGEKIKDPLSLYLADVNTVPINLAGVPAVSVPCGFENKLPIGLQLIGNFFDEKTILQAAHNFENSTDFHNRRPGGE